ncbi:MAG: DUF4175 family protein, partial [Pseudomonadota bacterium]
PATTMDDTVRNAPEGSTTGALWAAHRRRMAEAAEKLRVPTPDPRTDRHDPIALRALAVLVAVLTLGLAGHQAPGRLMAAFDFGNASALAARTRVDAWITPPTYTARAPIILTNGAARSASASSVGDQTNVKPIAVPEASVITVRASGEDLPELRIEAFDADGNVMATTDEPEADETKAADASNADAKDGKPADGDEKAQTAAAKTGSSGATLASAAKAPASSTIRDAKLALSRGVVEVAAFAGTTELSRWQVSIIPDRAPTIAMTKALERTRRGGMKLFYEVKDDYGVASAEARFKPLPPDEEDPRTQWARPDVLVGPRPPLERPPKITLRLPPRRSKDGKTWSFHEIGKHPWAGMRVEMTLVARDHAGNVGASKPQVMRLPERQFRHPLARAVIEQRRNLIVSAASDLRTRSR